MQNIIRNLLSILTAMIIGIAILAFMNVLNLFLQPDANASELLGESNQQNNGSLIYLWGKLISVFTACFVAGAISIIIRKEKSLTIPIIIGSIFMVLGLFDLFSSIYPSWYNWGSVLLCIPSAILGKIFIIKNTSINKFHI